MKAIVCNSYGSTDQLAMTQVALREPGPGEVRVRVMAASVNDFDWGMLTGKPYIVRFFNGLFRPKVTILGCDVAGVVDAAGPDTTLNVGDEVFGDLCQSGFGSFAEYVCAPESALLKKPALMSFAQAAALPQAGALAMQALFDFAAPEDGQQILFNGAGGGVGTIGLQVAKQWDVEVTCVDRADKLAMLRELGADHVLDYTEVDFTTSSSRYDLIVDTKTFHSPGEYLRVMKAEGKYVTVGGSMVRMLQILTLRRFLGKSFHIVSLKANRHLEQLTAQFESGNLQIVLDRSYRLEEVPAAIQHLVDADHRGKVIIQVGDAG